MTTVPSHLEDIECDLAQAARRRAARVRSRERVVHAGLALGAALSLASVALAASGVGLGWLTGGGVTEARFSIDATSIYSGPAATVVGCVKVSAGQLSTCSASAEASRVYDLLYRVSQPTIVTRRGLLSAIDTAVRNGTLSSGAPKEYERLVSAVGDEFFAKFALLSQLQTVSASAGNARGELVPPDGVPSLVTCSAMSDGTIACRPLRGAHDVPVGAPIYQLRVSADWLPRPTIEVGPSTLNSRAPLAAADDVTAEVFGRPLSNDERTVLTLLVTASPQSDRRVEPASVTPVQTPTPAP